MAAADASAGQRWVEACAASDLVVGEPRVVTLEQREVLLVRASDEQLFAIDNRCPHRGHPLAGGRVDGCVIQCAHHNYRFDLKSGSCLRGDEDATVYPLRVRDGKVELALRDRPSEADAEKRLKSLKDALANGRLDQAARDIARMIAEGVDATRIVLEMAAFDAAHNEFGIGRGVAVAADVLRIAPRYLGGEATLPLLHVAEVVLDASKYRAPRKVPASQDPGREHEGVGARLLALLDEGDAEGADGLMRGALWRKWTREQIEPWFFELNTAHFLGGGHGLIFSIKAFDLLEAAGFEHARRILPGLTYALVMLPRDDTLPAYAWFRQRFAQLEPRLAELWARAGQRTLADDERYAITRAILDGSREEAWHATIGALVSGGRIECVIDALSRAAAERIWRFDPSIDRDPSVSEGWLDVVHPFLYVHALRAAARRHRKSGLLKMVLYGVRAVNALKPLDMPADRWTVIDAKGRASFVDRERFLVDMRDLVRAREPVEAQRAALAYLNLGGSLDAFRASLYDIVLRGRFTCPAFTAHAIKLAVAVCDESMALPEGERTWPVRALLRMLASPVTERSLERVVHESRRLVEQGLTAGTRLSND